MQSMLKEKTHFFTIITTILAILIPGFGYLHFTDNIIKGDSVLLILYVLMYSTPVYLFSFLGSLLLERKHDEDPEAIVSGTAIFAIMIFIYSLVSVGIFPTAPLWLFYYIIGPILTYLTLLLLKVSN